jgi:hypothetical protein
MMMKIGGYNMASEHRSLINKTLKIQNKIPGVRLWSNPVGLAYNGRVVETYNKNGKRYMLIENPRHVTYGLCSGSSDIIGFKVDNGKPVFAGVEVKTPGDKRKPKQDSFHKMLINFGGYSGVLRNEDDIYEILNV